jgi:hypothetical protein
MTGQQRNCGSGSPGPPHQAVPYLLNGGMPHELPL